MLVLETEGLVGQIVRRILCGSKERTSPFLFTAKLLAHHENFLNSPGSRTVSCHRSGQARI